VPLLYEAGGAVSALENPSTQSSPASDFLHALFGDRLERGDELCIRALQHGGGEVKQEFYGNLDELAADQLQAWNQRLSIYFGTALRDAGAGHPDKAKKAGCRAITALWADLDAKDFVQCQDPKQPTVLERQRGKKLIREALQGQLPATRQPSILVDTGGGMQAYWLLESPIRFGPDEIPAIEATLAGLHQRIGADPSRRDITSLMRLPGTVNLKYPDRPMCRVVGFKPERRYRLEDFAPYRIERKSAPTPRTSEAGQDFPALLGWFTARGWYLSTQGEKYLVRCPWKNAHTVESGPTETALYEPSADNGGAGGFKCQHGHCAERRIADVYGLLKPPLRVTIAAPEPASSTKARRHRLVVQEGTDILRKRITWLWPGRIARGVPTLLIGDPDLGKGLTLADITARITTGRPWPDQSPDTPLVAPGHVIILSAEDPADIILEPRLFAAGADPRYYTIVDGVFGQDGEERGLALEVDVAEIDRLAEERGSVAILIDPINAYLGLTETNTDSKVRVSLKPLVRMIDKRKMGAVALMHLGKDSDRAAMYRALGSVGFTAAARASFCVARDPAEPESLRRLFLRVKFNIGPPPAGLVFQVTPTSVPAPDGGDPITTAKVMWLPEETHITANEALGRSKEGGDKVEVAERFLEEILGSGPVLAEVLKEQAKRKKISRRTLEQAKATVDVKYRKVGFSGAWECYLGSEAVVENGAEEAPTGSPPFSTIPHSHPPCVVENGYINNLQHRVVENGGSPVEAVHSQPPQGDRNGGSSKPAWLEPPKETYLERWKAQIAQNLAHQRVDPDDPLNDLEGPA
jgi:hypothetical protein